MIVDPSNVASLYANNTRDQRQAGVESRGEAVETTESRTDNEQTSETAPAVVTTLSAAALETSRAVKPPEQGADTNNSRPVNEGAERPPLPPRNEGGRGNERSRVDVVI